MNRQEANKQIVKRITDMVENQPDMRFHQILNSLGINEMDYPKKPDGTKDHENGFYKDFFYEESVETLKRMDKGNA